MATESTNPPGYWRSAARVYQKWASPLSPCDEDLTFFCQEAERASAENVLMLGVTPGLAGTDWPASSNLTAIDRSEAMINTLWIGDTERRQAICRDWLTMEGDASFPNDFDLCVSDGPFHNMPDLDGYADLVRTLSDRIRPKGILAMRFFIAPDEQESPEQLVEQLKEGNFSSFHVFKLHLLMALQPDLETAVVLHQVWDFWKSCEIAHDQLAESLGWPVEEIDTIAAYEGKDSELFFVTRAKLNEIFAPHFTLLREHVPSYPMGEQTPVLVFENLQ